MTTEHEDLHGVGGFFNSQWTLYKKAVHGNCLRHREAFAALDVALGRFTEPFSFLDLGAGDGESTARVLAKHPVRCYEAVDLSPVALGLAAEIYRDFSCPKTFTEGDYFEFVRRASQPHDVVFIGLSLHHLRADGKEEFFRALRPNVTQSFILFEPIRRPGETRDGVLDRWWKSVERDWKDFTPAELVQVHEHVFNCDFPEGIDAYAGMARAAGFAKAETLFVDDDEFYAVIECRAK